MLLDNIKQKAHGAKEWAIQHKTEIIVCGGIAVCIGVGAYGYKRINIFKPVLKAAVPQSPPVMTLTLKTSIVEPFRHESEIACEILRREHIRTLPAGWHASQAKIIEAAEKGVELRVGETFVNSCAVRVQCT